MKQTFQRERLKKGVIPVSRSGRNGKTFFGLAVLTVLLAAAAVLGSRVASLAPVVREEMERTPTPTPVYGLVMVVTPDPSLPTAPPTLRSGSVGDAVKNLQSRLRNLGYYSAEIDGQFGASTLEAVLLFQTQNGIQTDGIVGPETSELLFSAAARPMTATATPAPTAEPTVTPRPASRKPYEREDGLPLVVNRKQPLPDGYQTYDLVTMNTYCDTSVVKIKYKNTQAEREAVDALMVMLRAAAADGITDWQISAAYRTTKYQKQLFDRQVQTYMEKNGMSKSKATEATRKTVADPGTSEHHLGTCFDITVPGVSFKGTKQHKWLLDNCWDYGFILRYSEEKKNITGFLAEAWHYRYVGVEHAKTMQRENLCLEEYVQRYGVDIE